MPAAFATAINNFYFSQWKWLVEVNQHEKVAVSWLMNCCSDSVGSICDKKSYESRWAIGGGSVTRLPRWRRRKARPASRRKMWLLPEAVLARGDWPLLYDKLAICNTYWHAKNHNDLGPITLSNASLPEVGFPTVASLGGGWLQSPASDGSPCKIRPFQRKHGQRSTNLMYLLRNPNTDLGRGYPCG